MVNLYSFEVKNIVGEPVSMKSFEGKVLLIVNVASQCGFTPQYAGLEALYEKYKDKGFEVLGFPCNQFGSQEPGTEKEIYTFCETQFGVKFKLFGKVNVNGDDAHPIWDFLKKEAPGLLGSKSIKWNFTKFLVDRKGTVVERYAPKTAPEDLSKDIEKLLKN